ncbi:superoxide dismutase SOD2 SCDLUD_004910 [Saccharomycodes ludwigii]|uniref:superoxide dismutase SOD2 n=1 Tax=Saccharomycodes ludwigii TaxID=36035 RepID=UPI001E89BA9E|nr:hypothetical protein SCDLUD_004910 [Saccharomycodes ludwigii]KAH3899466.1 hypothetical protein SCDLUD_004910 [Saccharomycodes ludwigii]
MFKSVLSKQSRAIAATTTFKRTKVTLPELKWDFGALEPFISGQINKIHYTKHHQTYVNGLNTNTEKFEELYSKLDTDPVKIAQQLHAVQQQIKFHSGGYINHCLFWANLAPQSQGGGEFSAQSPLGKKVTEQFGSLENLQSLINAKLAGVQGVGWAFLCYNKDSKSLELISTYNQDTVTGNLKPLLAIDAWEHAYYLQYQNRKVEYFKAIWNVINWAEVAKRYEESLVL